MKFCNCRRILDIYSQGLLRCLRVNCLHCVAKGIRYNMIVNGTELLQLDHTHRTSLRGSFGRKASTLKISAAQLRSGKKNCTEITVFMCQQKPYPVWFSCLRKSYPEVYEHSLKRNSAVSDSPRRSLLYPITNGMSGACACQNTITVRCVIY